MTLAILGLGTAVPAHRYSQGQMARAAERSAGCDADQAEALRNIFARSGISHRHVVHGRDVLDDILDGTHRSGSPFVPTKPGDPGPDTRARMAVYEREVVPLAREAVTRALAESQVPPRAITHLVSVSCTGFSAPGFDLALIKALGMDPTVERTHVGFMGCHGAFNGLRVARAFAGADPNARLLVCAAELCSVHYSYTWDPKRMIGNALFADGAGAVVGAAGAGAWRVAATGSRVLADSEYAMSWTVGNHGFHMGLSPRVPDLIARNLRPWLDDWLRERGLAVADVGSWAVHPGGPRILTAVEETLGLAAEQTWASREVLRDFGNMSSATVLFVIERLRAAGAPLPCVALGFGPGLSAEVMLFR